MNVSFGNLIRATAEINESIFPVRHLCARLRDRQRRRRASSAATAAASTASRCWCRRRSTPTSSASGIRCRASPAAGPARRTGSMVRAGGAAGATRSATRRGYIAARGGRVLRVPLRRRRWLGRSARPPGRAGARRRARRVRVGRGRAARVRRRAHRRSLEELTLAIDRDGDGAAARRDASRARVTFASRSRRSRTGRARRADRPSSRWSATAARCAAAT